MHHDRPETSRIHKQYLIGKYASTLKLRKKYSENLCIFIINETPSIMDHITLKISYLHILLIRNWKHSNTNVPTSRKTYYKHNCKKQWLYLKFQVQKKYSKIRYEKYFNLYPSSNLQCSLTWRQIHSEDSESLIYLESVVVNRLPTPATNAAMIAFSHTTD